MRKLASIEIIKDINPIEGADKIEVVTIKGWKVVVRKDEFQVGDKVIYLEVDSWVPCQLAPFLCGETPKKLNGVEGARLKTVKLRGQISQGLVLPISILENLTVGLDITEILGIQKYEPQNGDFSGIKKGNFPSFIPKTDQERIQNLKELPETCKDFEVTEKLDGSSMTVYCKDGTFGVCSRNLELSLEDDHNEFVRMFNKFSDEQKQFLKENNYAVQGELIGPKIQSNPYKLEDYRFYVFNLFDIKEYKYVPPANAKKLLEKHGFNYVPVIDTPDDLRTLDEYLSFANGKSLLNPKVNREGVVFKDNCSEDSFKVISNSWLLKEK